MVIFRGLPFINLSIGFFYINEFLPMFIPTAQPIIKPRSKIIKVFIITLINRGIIFLV